MFPPQINSYSSKELVQEECCVACFSMQQAALFHWYTQVPK